MNKISVLKNGLQAGKILQNKRLDYESKNHLQQTVNNVIVNYKTGSTNNLSQQQYMDKVVNNKILNETKSSSMNTAANVLQIVLDTVGLFPPVGWMADIASMVISILRRQFMDGFLSAVSIVPVAGDAIGKPIKYLRKAIKYLM
jgi:hypothetical protein